MTAGMPSKTTATKAGAKGATKVARNRSARRAAKPAAKATWFVGKKVAKRKVRKHGRRYGDAARTAWSVALIYGPMAAEVLGVVEQPKPPRRFPAFLAGVAVGGGLMYLAGRVRPA
ncbi:MAG: hypothetical protein ACXVH3_38505 [Solirubrobacteraceae bacterium]